MKYMARISALIIFFMQLIIAIDNPHFYRATNLFPEPRIEHDFLTTFDITVGSGSTNKGRNRYGEIVPLFDIYGLHNMQELGVNVSYNTPFTPLLDELAQLPVGNNFATLSISGQFKIIESNLTFIKNLTKGFFFFLHLPIRSIRVRNILFQDLSPVSNSVFPNKNNPVWQQFLSSFDDILAQYGLSATPTHTVGAGDFTTLVGFTHNYQKTKRLDFVDFSIMAGFLAPTGKQKNENELFSFPLGYNGHWGLPISVMLSLGAYNWLTVGAYLNALFFAPNQLSHLFRPKTSLAQSGLIKLATGYVKADKGSIWHTGLYLKADHFARGLSCTLGYSCAFEQSDNLKLQYPQFTNSHSIINSDSQFKAWDMHTFHIFVEYDCAKIDSKVCPRVGFFYNQPITGKRIFTTKMGGGTFGLDIGWDM